LYIYDNFDARFVKERTDQFRDQIARRLKGELNEEQFRPLRLMNGVYLQLHAYMLRIAIPYGTLSATQMHKLADIADRFDHSYGHFTTRQNIQLNWMGLSDIPDILEELASVEMHAIQTSGNCIRNVTTDPYAGAIEGEPEDPRAVAELIRQWSSLHAEFSFLPRKFKVAITASKADRAAIKVHDVGLQLYENGAGEAGVRVWVGGGLGRTPLIASVIRDWLPLGDLLGYFEALMRVYNRHGRRDNKYKARIKILVQALGMDELTRQVEAEFAKIDHIDPDIVRSELDRIRTFFALPALEDGTDEGTLQSDMLDDRAFARWVQNNIVDHKVSGHAIVTISLKPIGGIPGDATSEQMHLIADLAALYSFDEIRTTHEQNIVLPHVRKADLAHLYKALADAGLGTANAGLASDIIACPGLDYCSLATARSIPVAQNISKRLEARENDTGPLKIKISGCINACGHHHVGHIGILGLDKAGKEYYQITLGGSGDENAAIGQILGPGFSYDEIAGAVETLLDTYQSIRTGDEKFLDTYRRVGADPFKEALYATA
jgi:sulfite reductase (NADPH) hemoprotein beta-component